MNKKAIAATAISAIITLSLTVKAAEEADSAPQLSPVQRGPQQAIGEWEFKSQWPARTSRVMMKLARNAEGKYEGTWKDNALTDITFENGKMKFVQTNSFGGQEIRTTYEVAADGNKITGKGRNQWNDFTFEGTPQREAKAGADAITGEWLINITIPAKEIVEKLTITENADGALGGKWEAQSGESIISDVKFEGGRLTFSRTMKFGDKEMTITFEGAVEGDNIKGMFKSERAEREANATRIASAKPAEGEKAEPNKPADEKKP